MFKAIIVDDEVKASMVLQNMISELDYEISVVSIINSSQQAKEQIERLNPDLIFMDVNMPHLNGFDVLESLTHLDYEIIFVTGYDDYALSAFKFSAAGYILKPIDIDHLSATISRAIDRLRNKKSAENNQILLQNLNSSQVKRIGIPTMEGLDFALISDIIRCEATMKCTKVIIENEDTIISSYSIGEFVKMLSDYGFYAVHKSHLVNIDKIKKYQKDGTITMSDGSLVPLARRRKQDFLNVIVKLN